MSEKASLLPSIPPVAKTAPSQSAAPTTQSYQSSPVKSAAATDASVATTQSVEGASEAGASITPFQGVMYASFILTFCLAGFAAVVLLRKASKLAEHRFVVGARTLGIASGIVALHGVLTTYLFANYLNGGASTPPLVVSMLLWIFIGPAVGVILNHLLTPREKPRTKMLIFNGVAYAAIFICAAVVLVPEASENVKLLFSLFSGFLLIVPLARFFSAFKIAKARHPELRELPDQILIYTLLLLPCLLPLVAFASAFGLSADLTQFLFNFITFDFVLIAGFAMLASADGVAKKAVVAAPEEAAAPVEPDPFGAAPAATPTPVPTAKATQPVVEFNAPANPRKPKTLPPRAPVRPGGGTIPAAPKKPGSQPVEEETPAANAPSRFKVPAKPKKRF